MPPVIVDRAALARLPVTRKSDLTELQKAAPPFAGMVAPPAGALVARLRVAGADVRSRRAGAPITGGSARACTRRVSARGEILHNTFAYHFTPAGFMFDLGAQALGCAVVPGGHGPDRDAGAGDRRRSGRSATAERRRFLRIILEKADELKADVASVKKALVSAEALPASLRQWLAGRAAIATLQCYASADLGLIAYESPAMEGMIVDEGVVVEIVRPGTGEPVPEGEVGRGGRDHARARSIR